MREAVTALGLLLASAPLGGQQAAPPRVAMQDQFENDHDVARHRGHVVVLIYGDRASAEANRRLGEQVHVAFHPAARGQSPARARLAPVTPVPGLPAGAASPDVLAVPIAGVGKVPGLVRRLIRAQLRSASPDVPVWLDFDDAMKNQFGVAPGVPNVVVLDRRGRYRHGQTGVPTAEQLQKLLGVIEALRREG